MTTDSRVAQMENWYNEAIEARCSRVRYAGVIRLLFFIGPLHMWFDEDQRTNTMCKKDWTASSNLITRSAHNSQEPLCNPLS